MKILLYVALLSSGLIASGSTYAQKRVDTLVYPNEKVIVETDSTTATYPGKQYTFNTFWKNWFIYGGAGGQVYFGDEDQIKPLGKRITATFEGAIGKWVHPAVGLRFKMGGGVVKGYSTGTLPSIGHSLIVGGPDANGIYLQRWHQLYLEGDIMVDLTNAFGGYKPGRLYHAIVTAGAGIAYAQNQPRHDGDRTSLFQFGFLNKFRINRNWDIDLEIKDAVVNQNYDREQSQKYYESFLGVTVGVTYNFGQSGEWPFLKGGGSKTVIQRTDTHIPTVPVVVESRSTDTVIKQETVREVTVEKQLVLSHPIAIFFDVDKYNITDKAKVNLAFVADIIKSSKGARFKLIGSADSKTASPKYNQKLSYKRSVAVREYLVQVLQVDPEQLILDPIGGIDKYSAIDVNRAVIIRQEQP
jgi:outer membrane protein OmpA-like peptidoglycan-associated protein